jgi:hypothetical protein
LKEKKAQKRSTWTRTLEKNIGEEHWRRTLEKNIGEEH